MRCKNRPALLGSFSDTTACRPSRAGHLSLSAHSIWLSSAGLMPRYIINLRTQQSWALLPLPHNAQPSSAGLIYGLRNTPGPAKPDIYNIGAV